MTTKMRWVLGIVLGLLFGVLPWTLFLFGTPAAVVTAIMQFNFFVLILTLAFLSLTIMRKQVVKPILGQGQGRPNWKQWILVGILLVCLGSTMLLCLSLGLEMREPILVFSFMAFVLSSSLWLREAQYWFKQSKALQTENEDLKRRLGSNI